MDHHQQFGGGALQHSPAPESGGEFSLNRVNASGATNRGKRTGFMGLPVEHCNLDSARAPLGQLTCKWRSTSVKYNEHCLPSVQVRMRWLASPLIIASKCPISTTMPISGVQPWNLWRLHLTHRAVGGSYWRLEGRLQVVGGQAKA